MYLFNKLVAGYFSESVFYQVGSAGTRNLNELVLVLGIFDQI